MKTIYDCLAENNAPLWMPALQLQNAPAVLLPGRLMLVLEQLSIVGQTCNPSTWETEAGRMLRDKGWLTLCSEFQDRLQSKACLNSIYPKIKVKEGK